MLETSSLFEGGCLGAVTAVLIALNTVALIIASLSRIFVYHKAQTIGFF